MSTLPLAQSERKGILWQRLGIQSEADHRMMLDEAARGRDRLSRNPENLTNLSRTDPRIRAPYRWDQLSETAKHREILNIYHLASPRTRSFYDRARYRARVKQDEWVEENWAIRWFLWHSFRYRDNREGVFHSQSHGGRTRFSFLDTNLS
ncbi:uncharacterized protein EI97DRAFT_376302 [Westerdykella ornata]|uniref:Uncharacterized protein n=1 Tax=Westerdykella ornata TaxID=318751 RepID=A0A6A6JL39_WESOR|nr:uncharacterized protein EI97DRAFT_376302 [Westerdykella ornata]KAF2276658.1 hypothetical protein EI97DRAFT_376302 [Westerdykella ornata]